MSRCRRWLSPTLQMTAVNFHLIAWLQWHDIIHQHLGNDSNLLIVFYVQIMPDDFVMQLHRF
ncbi:hypothetical protein A4T33_15125 [Escherichia coli]|nr:hypothetical protein A4T33_15125 [Escherichia coli]